MSVEADEFAERRVKLLLFERSTRLAAIDLMPHPRSSDHGRVTVFTSTKYELVSEQIEPRAKMVNALLVMTRWHSAQVNSCECLRLNQFSGHITI